MCVVNETGRAIFEGKAKSDPGDLFKLLRKACATSGTYRL